MNLYPTYHRIRPICPTTQVRFKIGVWIVTKSEIFETTKDFEFDGTILDKWVAQSKSNDGPDIESMEFIFDVIIKKMPPAVQLPFLGMKR